MVIPLTHTPQGNTTSTDYSGVPAKCDLQHGGHVADDHLHGNPGRRGQRRQELSLHQLLRDDAAQGRVSLGTTTTTTVNITVPSPTAPVVSVSESSLTIAELQLRHVHHSGRWTAQPTADPDGHHQRPIQHGRDRGTGRPDVLIDRLERRRRR